MPSETFDERLILDVPAMDVTHREFLALVEQLQSAGKADFTALFAELEAHTKAHFDYENTLMNDSGFAAAREHMDEHLRVLGDMHRLGERVARGSVAMARAYVHEQLPAWFDLHLATMDSALAAHLKAG